MAQLNIRPFNEFNGSHAEFTHIVHDTRPKGSLKAAENALELVSVLPNDYLCPSPLSAVQKLLLIKTVNEHCMEAKFPSL